jgi:hypothetical protein
MEKRSLAESEPTVGLALVHVVEASQQLLLERVELLLLQTQQAFNRAVLRILLLLAGVAVMAGAWIALNYALVEIVTRHASRFAGLLCCTALQFFAGLLLLLAGVRRSRAQRSSK